MMPSYPWDDDRPEPDIEGEPADVWCERKRLERIAKRKEAAKEQTEEVMSEVTAEVFAKLLEDPRHDGPTNGAHDVGERE